MRRETTTGKPCTQQSVVTYPRSYVHYKNIITAIIVLRPCAWQYYRVQQNGCRRLPYAARRIQSFRYLYKYAHDNIVIRLSRMQRV